MAYVYTPYKMSNATKNARKTARADEKTLRNYYENGYSQGAGGYKGQLNTAQQRLNTLYNNNNLSQQFNYSKQADYDRALNSLANREAFKYDINDDQLFQTAKEQYMQMGKAAMADTIGQASAMTGGYGNSYAATAGAQAYNAHIQQLNNSVGDYYSMALKAYENETNRLQGVFSAYQGDRATEQNEWKGNWDVYNTLYNTYSNDLNNLRQLDQKAWEAKGSGLSSVAGISANRANNYSTQDYNVWNSSQQHKATQAKQEEAAKQNAWERDYKERALNETAKQNSWERDYKDRALTATIKTKQQKTAEKEKKKNKLTSAQKTSAKKIAMKVLESVQKKGDPSTLPNLKEKTAKKYITEAQKAGKLNRGGAKEAYRILGIV